MGIPNASPTRLEVCRMINYTAKYTKIDSGYMGQLVEWPEIVTEGKDPEECRKILRDALNEMILAHQQLEKEIPVGNDLIEDCGKGKTIGPPGGLAYLISNTTADPFYRFLTSEFLFFQSASPD